MRWLIALAVLGVVALGGLFHWWKGAYGYRHPAGTLIKAAPVQKTVTGKKWDYQGYQITALAEFEMDGRVLLADRYYTGRESELSPVDLTLAWGPLSNTLALQKVSFMHLDRYYHWETEGDWPDKETITQNSANMHMIPADSSVDTLLKSVRREDLVHLKGYLVSCHARDGYSWQSSLTRADSGPGACEVVWVERLDVR